jgi:anti-anti-sigma regulatory factor
LPRPAKPAKPVAAGAPAKRARKPHGEDTGTAAGVPSSETTVALGADLRIGRAREIHQALTQTQAQGATLIVDGEGVAKVDAAGLQSVLAALVHSRTAGVAWRWHNPSLALKSAAQLLGLDGALELT